MPLPARQTTANLHEPPRSDAAPSQDMLLTDYQLEELYPFARSTFQKLRGTGRGPKYLKYNRKVFYRKSVVDAWISSFPELCSTSDRGAA